MVLFHTEKPILVYFGRSLDGKIWGVSWQFGIFVAIFVHLSYFGLLHQEKSGNPADGLNFVNKSSNLLYVRVAVRTLKNVAALDQRKR
jgi:hypothetical protein